MKSILVFLTFLAMTSATIVKFEKPEDFQKRTIVSSDSGNMLAGNSTIFIVGVVLVIGVLVAALVLSGGFNAARIQQRYGQKYHEALDTMTHYAHTNRYRRFAPTGNMTFHISFYYILHMVLQRKLTLKISIRIEILNLIKEKRYPYNFDKL